MVALDEVPTSRRPGPIELELRELPRRSKEADLQFSFWRWPDQLEIALTYNTELFAAGRAAALAAGLRGVLEAMADNRPVEEILRGRQTT